MKKLILLALLAGLVFIPNTIQASVAPAEYQLKFLAPASATWVFDTVKTPEGTMAVVNAISAEQKFVTELIVAYKKATTECSAGGKQVAALTAQLAAANAEKAKETTEKTNALTRATTAEDRATKAEAALKAIVGQLDASQKAIETAVKP